jgi:hypothetical protein
MIRCSASRAIAEHNFLAKVKLRKRFMARVVHEERKGIRREHCVDHFTDAKFKSRSRYWSEIRTPDHLHLMQVFRSGPN